MRLEAVTKDSPADQAGLLAGDVLLEIDGVEIADLKAFSDTLKTLTVGQTVEVVVRRGTEEITASVTVVAR